MHFLSYDEQTLICQMRNNRVCQTKNWRRATELFYDNYSSLVIQL